MPCSHLPPPDSPDPHRVEDRWLTETVNALARGVAADLAFDRLPILADALEDAGCDNSALFHHLRSDEPHRVECWALRRLLRTTLLLPGGVPMTFAYCPPGTFLMGDYGDYEEERPIHTAVLTRGFYAGVFSVTQAQWRAVTGKTPSSFKGDLLPIESVSWEEADRFCRRASELTRRGLRLPTEAEWEYACRAGSTSKYHYGDTPQIEWMNCAEAVWVVSQGHRPRERPTVVGTFASNAWELHDVHGNVWEWCADWYHPEYYRRGPRTDPLCEDGPMRQRVCRGGSWREPATRCRSPSRHALGPNERAADVGFRVVFTA